MTISVPEYFLAYLLIKYVAVGLGWFPSLANVSSDTSFLDRLYYAFLPMLTLVLVIVAHMMRMTRASVLAVMASPYIEMAILKGLTKTRIVIRHALPNALAPIISVIALNLAYLIVEVVVVETVFVYPGLGQLMVDEVSKHDVPVVRPAASSSPPPLSSSTWWLTSFPFSQIRTCGNRARVGRCASWDTSSALPR